MQINADVKIWEVHNFKISVNGDNYSDYVLSETFIAKSQFWYRNKTSAKSSPSNKKWAQIKCNGMFTIRMLIHCTGFVFLCRQK